MKRANELTIEMELTVKSPVHIGTGDNLAGTEYLIDGEQVKAIDIPRYLEDNPGEVETVISVMKDEKDMADLPDIDASYERYTLQSWVDSGPIGDSPVQIAIKDATNTPYIPGSSLKGWLRTALAYRMLNQTKNIDGTAAVADVMDEDDIIERFRVGDNDPKTDLMRCVTVRDAHPISDPELALCEIKTRRYKSAEDSDPSWMGFWNYAECLLPNWELADGDKTKFDTEIRVDLGLLEELVEFHDGAETARAVFGDDQTKDGILATIREALQRFQEAVIDEERKLFSREPFGSSNMIEYFYKDRMTKFYDDPSNDSVLFRVGAWTSHYSKTVTTTLPDENRIRANMGENISHTECGEEITEVENEDGESVLFCENCEEEVEPCFEEGDIDRFPKTRRGIYREKTNYNEGTSSNDEMEAYHPLGWIEASLRGPL